jgi:acetylornithine deacetylase/succinyl-diaminopimelate desuccinylase-like protein
MRAALILLLALTAQDGDELRKKIDRVVSEETDRSRSSLLEALRQDLGRAPAPVRPPDAVPAGTLAAADALVTEELLRGHATFLADDALEGRAAGYPGNDKAGDYVAGVFKDCGLVPAGEEGGWFQTFKVRGRATRNVLGLLEGSDPQLKDEIVVVGAHYDHVGTGDQPDFGRLGNRGEDRIWNGADDNGSGTTALLGAARAFGKGGLRAKRTVLFIAFSGEEAGLIGSAWYCRSPIRPIEKHVFMLNLDMVGRNPQRPMEIHGVGSAEGGVVRRAVERAVGETGLQARLKDEVEIHGGDSDHSSFRDRKVPYAFFFSGFHADYHRPSDTADKLAYPNLVKVSRSAVRILLEVGGLEDRPRFAGAARGPRFRLPEAPEPGFERPARRLGVVVQALDDTECELLGLVKAQGGLRIEAVNPGSAALTAGIKDGDVVLSLAGEALPRSGTQERLRDLLRDRVKPGQEVELVVLRQGNKLNLKAKWDQ